MRFSFKFSRMWIFHWIKFSWNSWSMWKELGWLKWLQFFFCKGLSSFNLKGFSCSHTCSSSLCESTTSCCTRLITIRLWELFKLFRIILIQVFVWLYFIRIFLLFPLSITLFVFMYSFSRWFEQHRWRSFDQPIT